VGKLKTVLRDIFATDGEYYISPILECDRDNYTELHRQINGEGSLYLNPVSKDILKQYGNLVGGVEKGEELFKQFFDEDSENEVIYRYKLLPEVLGKQV
jgi:hypothetical protein